MNQFYQLYSNTKYETAIQYSFDCVGYMDIIENFPKLAKCNFSKKTTINKMTYPVTKDAVKNNIVLDYLDLYHNRYSIYYQCCIYYSFNFKFF